MDGLIEDLLWAAGAGLSVSTARHAVAHGSSLRDCATFAAEHSPADPVCQLRYVLAAEQVVNALSQ
jgi:hypothetical protein